MSPMRSRKGTCIEKVLDIIGELKGALNIENKGQKIAFNLDAIYNYLLRSLLEGDIRRDLNAFESAILIMSELKEAWETIASKSKEEASPQQKIAA